MKSKTIVLAVLFSVSFLVATNFNINSLKAGESPCILLFGPGCLGFECPPGTIASEVSEFYCYYVICQPGSYEVPCWIVK